MIEFSAKIKPYSVKNECGDFYLYLELEDYNLIVVGDIGGHGSFKVYDLACQMKEVIKKNKNKSLNEIIMSIHKQDSIKNNGMTIFIAQIYHSSPLISYCTVGNTKAILYRKNNIISLHSQEGIVGYDIPRTINTNLLKVLKDDTLVIVTDGVSFHNDEINNILNENLNSEDLAQSILNHCSNDDDSLCAVFKFDISNNDFSIKHNDNKNESHIVHKYNTNTNEKINLNKSKILPLLNTNKINTFIGKMDDEYLLVSHLKLRFVSLVIDKLNKLFTIKKIEYIKLKTFLLEVLNFTNIDIYIKNNTIQLYIYDIKYVHESLEFLFQNYIIKDDHSCIINISFEFYEKVTNDELKDIKQMLELGLTEEGYLKFKDNENKLQKMSEQARLVAMGEMIGNIAHQWRQPLSVISTSATGMLFQKEYGLLSDEKFEKICTDINTNAQYLSKTIDDFRDFIKGENESVKFDTELLINKARSIFNSSLKDSYIELIVDNNSNHQLYAPLNLLIQVLVNIVNNAKDILVEKSVEKKLIFINTNLDESNLIISVLDNAGGVPKKIISKIFDAYFTTKHQSQGTGLGLNMAHNIIINTFAGKLEVENKNYEYKNIKYTGANFIITIPRQNNEN